MKDFELPPLPEPDICRYVVTVWRDGVECEIDKGPRYTVEQMQSYARAAVEADRAQRVPDDWKLVPVEPTEEMLCAGDDVLREAFRDRCIATRTIYDAMLASTPAPAQQECWCETCDLAQGNPLGRTRMSLCPECGDKRCPRAKHHDNACAQHQEPPQQERKPMTDAVIRERARLYLQAGRSYRGLWDDGVELASRVLELGFIEGAKAAERHHGIKEQT